MPVINALLSAVHHAPRPVIFHSDNGSEYDAEDFVTIVHALGTQISRSAPGCPWENGYQESFYGKFKVDLGDPDRFATLGELVYAIYQTLYVYNHSRIHTALKMSPLAFAEMHKLATMKQLEDGVQWKGYLTTLCCPRYWPWKYHRFTKIYSTMIDFKKWIVGCVCLIYWRKEP